MKLYACPGTCSLAPHIALHELGLPHEFVTVDIRNGCSSDHLARNPLGAVPVLELDSGHCLTECMVILQYLADQKPEVGLAPPPDSLERYQLQQWLSLIATEIHKSFPPLFFGNRMVSDEEALGELQEFALNRLRARWRVVADRLSQQDWLLPSGYSVADIYLYVTTCWWLKVGQNFEDLPAMRDFIRRIETRPAVSHAREHENKSQASATIT